MVIYTKAKTLHITNCKINKNKSYDMYEQGNFVIYDTNCFRHFLIFTFRGSA